MAELKLLSNRENRGNRENKENSGNENAADRKTTELMLKGYHAPEDLKLRTLGAMDKIRKDRQHRRRSLMRAATAAAVMVMGVALTPLSGCARSVAESAYQAVQEWFDSSEHFGYTRYSNGCRVTLIQASVVNDFLCVTLEEDYSDFIQGMTYYYDDDGKLVEADASEPDMMLRIAGEISDSSGNAIQFTNENVDSYYNGAPISTDVGYRQSYELQENVNTYRIYLPGLRDLIDAKGKYTFRLDVTPCCADDYAFYDARQYSEIDTMSFRNMVIKNVDSVLNTTEYPLNHTESFGNIRVDFLTLLNGQTESCIIAQVTPQGELAEKMDGNGGFDGGFDPTCSFNYEGVVYKKTNLDMNIWDYLSFEEKNRSTYESPASLVQFDGTNQYCLNGTYYLVMTYDGYFTIGNVGLVDNNYDRNKVIDPSADAENEFGILWLSYDYEQIEEIWYGDEGYTDDIGINEYGDRMAQYRTVYRDSAEIRMPASEEQDNHQKVITALEPQSFGVGSDNRSASAVKTFKAGDLTVEAAVTREINDNASEFHEIEIRSIYLGNELLFSADRNVNKMNYYFMSGLQLRFAGVKDGQEVFRFWYDDIKESLRIYEMYEDEDEYEYDTEPKQTIKTTGSWYSFTNPSYDDIVLEYAEYRTTDDDGQPLYHMYINPEYYNDEGESYASLREKAANELFAQRSTFTVG